MSANAVALAVRMTGDVSDVEEAFGAAGDAATAMAHEVDNAADVASSAASRLDGVAAAAENVDSTAAKVTGSLGALSSGFELVGLDQYAGGLQAAAQASDFVSGAGQALTLILGQQRAATIANAIATKATSVATKAYAVAQGILNAVLAANPIALVVIAIAALVAGFVLAYKRSETFRTIVQAAMTVVKTYVDAVVTVVSTLVSFVADKAPPAFDKLKTAASAVGDFFRDKIGPAFSALLTPVQAVIDAVQHVLDLIGKIKLPDLGKVNPFSSVTSDLPAAPPAYGGSPVYGATVGTTTVNVYPQPLTDPNALALALVTLLRRSDLQVGMPG